MKWNRILRSRGGLAWLVILGIGGSVWSWYTRHYSAKPPVLSTKSVLSLIDLSQLDAQKNPPALSNEDEEPTLAKKSLSAHSASAHSSLATPPPSLTPAQIAEALQSDNICLLFRHFKEEDSILKVLVEKTHPPSADILSFFNALYQANLFESLSVAEPDFSYAEQVFEALHARDPQNGAYDYYAAESLAALDAPLEKQKEWLLLALRAPYFHTFLKSLGEAMQQDLIQNATTWFEIDFLLYEIPVPKPPFSLIQKIFAEPTPEEAKQIVDFGLQLNEDEQSMPLEYEMARRLVEKNWAKTGSTSPIPNLRSLMPNSVQRNFDAAMDVQIRLGMTGECDRAPVDAAYEAAKAAGFHWQ